MLDGDGWFFVCLFAGFDSQCIPFFVKVLLEGSLQVVASEEGCERKSRIIQAGELLP